jgi:hypothetical protein
MKSRSYIVTLAVCAAAVLGTPAAQAYVLSGEGSYVAVKSTSSQSLAAMRAAGTNYHASAARSLKAQQTAVRPDDRSGPRGI